MEKCFDINNEKDLVLVVEEVLKLVTARSMFILCVGELGSGKTTFTKYLAEKLGISETIISPTFIIQREYFGSLKGINKTLEHLDFYRIESSNELDEIDLKKEIKDNTVFVIEWADKFDDFVKNIINEKNADYIYLYFEHVDIDKRKVKLVTGAI